MIKFINRAGGSAPLFAMWMAICLTSCAVGPEFRAPTVELVPKWHYQDEESGVGVGENVPLAETTQIWWDEFCDADMKRMIDRLIEGNPDLHRARARIDEALAQRQTHIAGRIPHADFTGRMESGIADFEDGKLQKSDPRRTGEFAQIDAGWELDLFGQHARKIEASTAQARSQVESWRDVLVFLISEVSLYYTEMRVNEARAELAGEFVSAYREVVRISEEKEKEGVLSRLDLEVAMARLRKQESLVPDYERQAAQAKNRLGRLLACAPVELEELISKSGKIPAPPKSIYAGVPADVIRTRPDIRAAEDKIAAQVARIGEATSLLYPKLHLSGAITYEAIMSGSATELLRQTIGGGTTLTKRLFHAGADTARVHEEDAVLQQTLRTYESTVLTALNEVEDALADIHYGKRKKTLIDQAAKSSEQAGGRVQDAFSNGLVDVDRLLRVLEERYEIETEQIFARNLLAKGSLRLYKATGGGQLPLPPLERVENLVATEYDSISRPLSILFSLGSDSRKSLHLRQGTRDKKEDEDLIRLIPAAFSGSPQHE